MAQPHVANVITSMPTSIRRGAGRTAGAGPSIHGGATPAAGRGCPKVGRNDPVPCGSGKKYKQCHGRLHLTQGGALLLISVSVCDLHGLQCSQRYATYAMAVNLPLPVAANLKPVAGIELGYAEAGVRKANRKDLLVMKLAPTAQRWPACSRKNRFCAAPVQVCQAHLAARA